MFATSADAIWPSPFASGLNRGCMARVRNLVVQIRDDTVVLEGQCSTYYTKQIAQHTALGVLENEHLENSIAVRVPD